MSYFDENPRHSQMVETEAQCASVIAELLPKSCWFQVEPYPDGEWMITVKRKNSSLLNRLCAERGDPFLAQLAANYRHMVRLARRYFDRTLCPEIYAGRTGEEGQKWIDQVTAAICDGKIPEQDYPLARLYFSLLVAESLARYCPSSSPEAAVHSEPEAATLSPQEPR